jgi:hypothetical protein
MQSDTLFFNTLKTFQQKFKDSFATTNDFKQVAEQVSGKNLTAFFNQWIYGEGYPTYSVSYGKPHSDSLLFTITQTTSMPTVTPFFSGLLELKITSAQGDTIIKVNHTANNQQFKIKYPKSPSGIEVDPNNWILNKVGSVVTGINIITPEQAGVKIYPNPTTNFINLTFSSTAFQSLQLMDIQGRHLQSAAIPAGATMHRQSINLPPGTYFIRLVGKKGNVVQKILVR